MLTTLLKKDAVPMETLHERYGALLQLVKTLIGVVPNCDPYLEIWPPAFRSYNVMVPNFLNLPFLVWGMGPRQLMGLGMYVSSRTAECPYCSAHTCSFALRRGTSKKTVADALDETKLGESERAVAVVAKALSRIPADLTASQRDELKRLVPDWEWIVLGIAMMGFLNKFMDAIGVELETETVKEVNGVIAPSGWTPGQHGAALAAGGTLESGPPPDSDGFWTRLGVLRHAPSALSLDKKWTAGIPKDATAARKLLYDKTGHDFPILSKLTHKRAVVGLATMLRDNLDATTTVVGLPKKRAAGLIYAEIVQDSSLKSQLAKLGPAEDDVAITALARAVSPSPAAVDESVLAACRDLSAAAVVEVVTFVSVLQLWHRLEAFYA
jgi:alkylhydroperoxidase family enzyme